LCRLFHSHTNTCTVLSGGTVSK